MTPSTEAKIKHTPLDLDKLERRVKRFGGAGGATVFALLAELRGNRRLLEQWNEKWKAAVDESSARFAKIVALEATLEPVRSWYDGDGEETDVVVMLTMAIADLQTDRKDYLKSRRLLEAGEVLEKAVHRFLREDDDWDVERLINALAAYREAKA